VEFFGIQGHRKSQLQASIYSPETDQDVAITLPQKMLLGIILVASLENVNPRNRVPQYKIH